MTLQRLRDDPHEGVSEEGGPFSRAVADTIAHDRKRIDALARYSAMHAMPLILARGERTTLDEEAARLVRTVERLVGQAIDDGHGNAQDTCGVFSVEVYLSREIGEGFSDRAKNRNVIDVDVTIPLEYATLALAPQHYARLAKAYDEWLGGEDD